MASQANKWQEPNNARYCNLEYDRLWAEAKQELDPQKRAELYQQMNQLLAEDIAGHSPSSIGLWPTPSAIP